MVVLLTYIPKTFAVVSLIGIVTPAGLYAVVTVVPVVYFAVYINLFVVETAVSTIVFAVPTFEILI